MKNASLFIFLLLMVFLDAYTQTDNLLTLTDFKKSFTKHDPKMPEYEKYKDRHSSYKINVNNQDIPINTYSGQAPDEHQLDIVRNVIVDDFLVNDDTIGETAQYSPSIALDGSGNFVIAWVDERNSNGDIYYQRYNNNGVKNGLNFRANDDAGTTNQSNPSIAMDGNGNFVIAWVDERNSNGDIYYQRYSNNGVKNGLNTKANDDGTANQYSPSIAMDGSGNFVIVWVDERNSTDDIYYQRYTNNGIKNGLNVKANDDEGTATQYYPSIAMDGNGNFVIAWVDGRNGNSDIYYQRYSSIRSAQGANTKANDDAGTTDQYDPSIAMDGSGNFVIAWVDERNSNYDIYYQRYNSIGSPQGINTKANDVVGTSYIGYPSIAMDGNGNFVIAWIDERNKNFDIYYQRYNSTGTAQGVNTKANDDSVTRYQIFPSIAMDGSGSFVIVWEDKRNGYSDIYFQRYNSIGSAQGDNTKANDDTGTTVQGYPSIAMDGSGNFVIVWDDTRNGNYNIYFQRYNSIGSPQGVNTKANDGAGTTNPGFPSIAMDGSGNFVIVWEYRSIWNYDIYYQRYNSIGLAQGVNKKANDDTGIADQGFPSIAMDGSGNFVIVWQDERNGNFDIYYQRYNSNGTAQGANTKANDYNVSAWLWYPTIAIDGSGNFVIAWQEFRNDSYDIYYQQYNSSGIAQGVNTKANDDAGTSNQYAPSIAMDGSGNFVIAWYDERNGNYIYDIYFQRYNSSGAVQGVNTKANDDAGTTRQNNPSIAMENSGRFVIVWEDYRNGIYNPDLIGQRFYSDGNMNGGNYRIVADGPNYGEESPVVAANSDKITFAWMDNRRSKGWDIYGKIVGWDWDSVTSVSENDLSKSKEFELTGNFPNPFYDNTSFEYLLGNKSNIDVSVFDIHGNKIRTLLKESQDTGRHSLTWDGKNNNGNNVNKGVYLIRFSSSTFQAFTKTILLK